jgi:hypothetical protein
MDGAAIWIMLLIKENGAGIWIILLITTIRVRDLVTSRQKV